MAGARMPSELNAISTHSNVVGLQEDTFCFWQNQFAHRPVIQILFDCGEDTDSGLLETDTSLRRTVQKTAPRSTVRLTKLQLLTKEDDRVYVSFINIGTIYGRSYTIDKSYTNCFNNFVWQR